MSQIHYKVLTLSARQLQMTLVKESHRQNSSAQMVGTAACARARAASATSASAAASSQRVDQRIPAAHVTIALRCSHSGTFITFVTQKISLLILISRLRFLGLFLCVEVLLFFLFMDSWVEYLFLFLFM